MLPDQQGPWSRLDHNEPFIPGAPPKPPQANFYPAGATKAEVEAWIKSLPAPSARARPASSRRSAAAPDGRFIAVPYSLEYQGELAHGGAAAARGGGAHDAADAEGVPRSARRGVPLATTTTTATSPWMELDATHRADHRPVRGLRGRVVQLQGGVRGVHHRARRRRDATSWQRFGGELQEIENNLPIDPKYRNPEARRAGADRASSTPCSRPATATAACRRRPSTCPTTSA